PACGAAGLGVGPGPDQTDLADRREVLGAAGAHARLGCPGLVRAVAAVPAGRAVAVHARAGAVPAVVVRHRWQGSVLVPGWGAAAPQGPRQGPPGCLPGFVGDARPGPAEGLGPREAGRHRRAECLGADRCGVAGADEEHHAPAAWAGHGRGEGEVRAAGREGTGVRLRGPAVPAGGDELTGHSG